MNRVTVDHQMNRTDFVLEQALEEFNEPLRVHRALEGHEPEDALRGNRTDDVERKAAARGLDHRRLAHRGPGGTGMVIRAAQPIHPGSRPPPARAPPIAESAAGSAASIARRVVDTVDTRETGDAASTGPVDTTAAKHSSG